MRKLLILLTFALGCGSSTAPNPASDSLAGVYAMKTVNGASLPFSVQNGATKATITSDALTVADGGTWSESGFYTQTINGSSTNQVISIGGTYIRSGVTVSFVSSGKTVYNGTFTGSGFNLTDGTYTYTYSR